MSTKTLAALVLLLSLSVLHLSGCAASLCERKDRAMITKCAGTDVVYTPDPVCEDKIKTCNAGQLAQLEGYVKCLEQANVCSQDVIAACGSQYPGGLNIVCDGAFQ